MKLALIISGSLATGYCIGCWITQARIAKALINLKAANEKLSAAIKANSPASAEGQSNINK